MGRPRILAELTDRESGVETSVLYEPPAPVGVTTQKLIHSVKPQVIVAAATIADRLKKNPQGVYDLTSRQFEELVLEILKDRGHDAYLTPATRDGEMDVLAYFESDFGKLLCLIETKRYSPHRKVGFGMVQRLYGALASQGANCAMLITVAEPETTIRAHSWEVGSSTTLAPGRKCRQVTQVSAVPC